MGLEALTGADKFLDDLVITNPVGASDFASSLDDHIRGIKNVLKNTFPNLNAAVTATPAELNSLAGRAAVINTFLQAADAAAARTAIGTETGITGTLRTFTKTQAPSRRVTSSSADGTAITWDMQTHNILSHTIDTAAAVAVTFQNPVVGASYKLQLNRTGAGVGFGYTRSGPTFKDGDNIIAIDDAAAYTIVQFYAATTSLLFLEGQENYT